MRIDIITIFPEYFGPLGVSLIGKAAARGDIEFRVHDLRQWAHDIHRTVDDAPFGGGPGMVMKAQVWAEALEDVAPPVPGGPVVPGPRLIVPTPSGVPFTQARAASYTRCPQLIFACGRYEGIDARFIDEARSRMPVDEVSIGDYVLAGGEAAVLVMVEAIGRLLPGVLGNERSARDDSFGGAAAAGDAASAADTVSAGDTASAGDGTPAPGCSPLPGRFRGPGRCPVATYALAVSSPAAPSGRAACPPVARPTPTPAWPASSKGPSTPAPVSGGGARCRMSCCPVTMRRSRGGGGTPRCCGPRPTGRISSGGPPLIRAPSAGATGRCCRPWACPA